MKSKNCQKVVFKALGHILYGSNFIASDVITILQNNWLILQFDEDLTMWALQMKVVLRASDCYDKREFIQFLFILDVDPADGKGQLTVTCHKQFIFVSGQG